jgi:pimeloyl-ACP methyl ester carboxylesterase
MAMAATRPGTLLGAILNDIGGEIEAKGLSRILEFIGREPRIANWDAAVAGLKRDYAASFPDVGDGQWAEMARALYREEDGWILPDYDPRLGDAMREGGVVMPMGPNVPLWPVFAALATVPTLVLRGANSDLLSAETVAKMAALKPDLVRVTIPNRGHVPFLDETEAVAAIDAFLTRYG